MIAERLALLRQAQVYFHQLLLGVVKWDDVIVERPIPVPSVKGFREQGKVRDIVIANFNGFRMEMTGPFESDKPLGWVEVTHGDRHVGGPLDAATWVMIADFIKREKPQGDSHGTSDICTDVPSFAAGTNWGR